MDQFLTREHASRAPRQRGQEIELARREAEEAAFTAYRPRFEIDFEILVVQRVHFAQPGTPQRRMQPRGQFLDIEGLGQIIVADAVDPVAHLAPGGEHDDGHLGEAPDHGHEREAIDLGQHDVQHDAFRLPGADQREPRDAVGRAAHLEAFERERYLQHPPDAFLVVDNRDAASLLLHRTKRSHLRCKHAPAHSRHFWSISGECPEYLPPTLRP